MSENQFWKYFDTPIAKEKIGFWPSNFADLHLHYIKEDLRQKGKEAIIGFGEIFSAKMRSLYIPSIAEIYSLTLYDIFFESKQISNNGFLDFRAWIISLGKKNYEVFLNFIDESEIISFNLNPEHANREDLFLLTYELLKEINVLDEYKRCSEFDKTGGYKKLNEEMDWDRISIKYPNLFKKWNPRLKHNNSE